MAVIVNPPAGLEPQQAEPSFFTPRAIGMKAEAGYGTHFGRSGQREIKTALLS
ncbi:MAG: hypothetical protein KF849_05905 [Rhizobiaceae bacterium]|nr:hypothetical protein [Rhizobiaceae bacterium]